MRMPPLLCYLALAAAASSARSTTTTAFSFSGIVGTGTTRQWQTALLLSLSAKNISPDEHPNSNRIRQDEQIMMTDTGGGGMQSSHCRRRRRQVLGRVVWGLMGVSVLSRPEKAMALVKGNAPPPKVIKGSSASPTSGTTNPTCTNVETCQEMAEQELVKSEQAELAAQANLPPIQTTSSGTRYRTMVRSPFSENKAVVVRIGDTVRL
eukprot:scaffold105610_cov110-Attheya_sp.AAC.1